MKTLLDMTTGNEKQALVNIPLHTLYINSFIFSLKIVITTTNPEGLVIIVTLTKHENKRINNNKKKIIDSFDAIIRLPNEDYITYILFILKSLKKLDFSPT